MQHVCMFPDRSTLHEEYHAFKVAKRILRTGLPHTKLDLASMDYWNPPRACSGHPLLSSSVCVEMLVQMLLQNGP